MRREESYSVMLDTSFLIRLLSENNPLHDNAVGYFKYFLENDIPMYVSTVTVAEYCVDGDVSELPLRNVRIVPFNFQHSPVAGKYAKALFDAKKAGKIQVEQRKVIPNDVKIFAQADCTQDIKYFVTSDVESSKLLDAIAQTLAISFSHIDINIPYSEQFGILDIPVGQ